MFLLQITYSLFCMVSEMILIAYGVIKIIGYFSKNSNI